MTVQPLHTATVLQIICNESKKTAREYQPAKNYFINSICRPRLIERF